MDVVGVGVGVLHVIDILSPGKSSLLKPESPESPESSSCLLGLATASAQTTFTQAGTTGTTSSGRHGMRGFGFAPNPHCRPSRATITICIDYHPFILLQSHRYRPTLRGHRTAEPARSRRLYLIQQPGPRDRPWTPRRSEPRAPNPSKNRRQHPWLEISPNMPLSLASEVSRPPRALEQTYRCCRPPPRARPSAPTARRNAGCEHPPSRP